MNKDHKKRYNIHVRRDDPKTEPAKDSVKEENEQPKKKLVYVHEPGTVHLSAYEQEVEDKKLAVDQAKADLEVAKKALREKKEISSFEEVVE